MDIRTLLVCSFSLLALYTAVMLLIRVRERDIPGLGWLAACFGASTVGSALGAGRGYLPDALSIVGGNALIMVGYLALHQAIADFLGMPRRHARPGVALLALLVAGAVYFTAVDNDARPRIALFSVLFAAQVGLSAALLLRADGEPGLRMATRSLGGVLALFAALNVLRAAATLAGGAPADFMQGDVVQAASLLAFIVTTSSVGYGFVWMISARLRAALHDQARRDDLTGLLNRRGFMERAGELRRAAERRGERLLLLFADVDGLKEVNDTAGHAAGDGVLREAAAALRDALPEPALVARLGGDEFCALLTLDATTDGDAYPARVAELVEARGARPDRAYRFGISAAGVLVEPDETESLEALLHAVDDQMYATKRARKAGSPAADG